LHFGFSFEFWEARWVGTVDPDPRGAQNFIDRCIDNKSYQTEQHKKLFALLDSPLSFGSWMGWDLRPLARMERQNFIDRCVDNKSYQYFPNILDDPEKVDFRRVGEAVLKQVKRYKGEATPLV
jgi:hypothetical protein